MCLSRWVGPKPTLRAVQVGVFEAETAAALWHGLGGRAAAADFLLVDAWAGHDVAESARALTVTLSVSRYRKHAKFCCSCVGF